MWTPKSTGRGNTSRSGPIGTVNRKLAFFRTIIRLIIGIGGSREKMEYVPPIH
jgi:hypothetical protein